ncbi:MAG: LysR family transcriptional regulator [Betaproteobacteria bacterium]|nr:LysR family transcriptional regulator [Betaproteobacteria bacterium]
MAASTKAKSSIASIASRNLLDSKRLFYFFHVARLGSCTMAEAVLDVSQSAISRQIQQLETELGEQLLQRTGRGVTVTDAGEIVFRQAELILQEMSETVEMVDRIKRRPTSGRITIASPPIFANMYMPEAVQRFIEAFPDGSVDAYEASAGLVYEYLVSGKVDMAIVLHKSSSQKMTLQKLVTEPLLLMVGRSHPLVGSKTVTRETLSQVELTMPSAPHGSRALLEDYCEKGGIHLDLRLRLDSLAMTKAVVAKGRICAVLPVLAFLPEIEQGDIVAIPLVPNLKRTVYLASLRERAQTPYMQALAREIANVVRSKVSES